ncbi:sulfotransferase [Candidatus Paraluminiphilus aquimaris]|uniref:Sulfotransferase n=1 Tax=Candidatus Paraluminiphilus aquimaris TaxID=2518994 RepID=A0ABY6Q5Y4_9GAMM|nr:sulfotransferase [Candidatus Paraluminiphilus aquimaris]UZP74320.1 sulfotransferase [Candidatus Paraluminiphilus aquimaris]
MTKGDMGHVFIVGVPRSGTTLVRDLISRHPEVAMPQDEFQLIPFLIKRFGSKAKLHDTDINRYLTIVKRSAFYHHRKADTPLGNWRPKRATLPEVISETLRHFAPKETFSDLRYVGDKTPNNLLYLEAITESFPRSKFIHVVRDPRDVALSARKAWKKSLIRAAHQWQRGVAAAYHFAQKHPDNILTVRYEDLLADSRTELLGVCNFLNLQFDESLLELTGSREKMGDAAGYPGVKTDNAGKFEAALSEHEHELFTSYIHKEMAEFGYECAKPRNTRDFSQLELAILSLYDLMGSTLRHIKDKGLIGGIRYRLAQILLR